MKLTPEQYAEMVIFEIYRTENIYNLASSIGYTATKIAMWASKKAEISTWATDGTEEHQAKHDADWEVADFKFKAYVVAFNTLSAKLPDFTK
jgi:hypothetical protein